MQHDLLVELYLFYGVAHRVNDKSCILINNVFDKFGKQIMWAFKSCYVISTTFYGKFKSSNKFTSNLKVQNDINGTLKVSLEVFFLNAAHYSFMVYGKN